jgi:diacylglycerol kinase family enzyme
VVVIAHPQTVDLDELRRLAGAVAGRHGHDLLRVEATTPADSGGGLARRAVAEGCQLVICCGGDGTVRAVATALAGTDIPLGVLPSGTGNLLARNLHLPVELADALEVAFGGLDRRLDCGRIGDERFVVMAGMGLDAAMVGDASPRLKKTVGWPAYALSGASHLLDPPLRLQYRLDDGPWQHRDARAVIVGNVGTLQAGVALFPEADPTDGMLELVVLSPRGLWQWMRIGARLLRRSTGHDPRLTRHRFRHLVLRTEQPAPVELDGDRVGASTSLAITVEPAVLLLRVPR